MYVPLLGTGMCSVQKWREHLLLTWNVLGTLMNKTDKVSVSSWNLHSSATVAVMFITN